MYDIIPDIHGNYTQLKKILKSLDYSYDLDVGSWVHPEGRKAAFLGDFIDDGTENYLVIETVREMVEKEQAVAIMGNHEFNAIMYHTEVEKDVFLRPHNPDNNKQHATFLAEFPVGEDRTKRAIDWFMTLPLFLELDEFRMVHAYWDDAAIDNIKAALPTARLTPESLPHLADLNNPLAIDVERILKGVEFNLPENYYFIDYREKRRTQVRLKWWNSAARAYRASVLSVPDHSTLPDHDLPEDFSFPFYREGEKPVFCGHYKLLGKPQVEVENVLCLDYPNTDCAYVWSSGDLRISQDALRIFA